MKFGATILDAEGLRLTADEKALFRDAQPFGFILFARNIDTPDQIRALCDDFRNAVGRDCLITIDQEGGRVQRLRSPLARDWQPALDHVRASGENAARTMYLRSRLMADELRALGIDSNCAPLGDIAGDQTHPFLRNRCYGETAAEVTRIARAVADGLLDGGVVPVLKHVPGHGRAQVDSHLGLPQVSAGRQDLVDSDFAPFRALNNIPMGMTAHLVYDQIDTAPATISPKVMQMIRDDIGFDGLIMTDDISMKALQGEPADLAKQSLSAGCDIVLLCNGSFQDRAATAEASGLLSDAGQRRAEAAIAARQPPKALDLHAAEDELANLMTGAVYV